MSLSALIKKGGLRGIATATVATLATDAPQQRRSVAIVATVAVATALDRAANDPAHVQDLGCGLSLTQADVLALTDSENLKEPKAVDPDRHSWPHTTAMNTAEIDAFTARVHLFTQRGIDTTLSEVLADGLVIRDRGGDDRRLCLECLHLRGDGKAWNCNQWRGAGLAGAGAPAEWVTLLQRCSGFGAAA